MLKTKILVGAAIIASLASVGPSYAATVVVTSPTGLYTNPTPVNLSGPGAGFDTWFANNVRSSGAAGITTAHPDNGNGSVQFDLTASSNSKADFEYYFTPNEAFLLSDLTAFSYDSYRSSTSTASAKYDPALRLYVSDGSHTGYLVYEGIYNNQPVAPVDTFQSVNALPAYIWATGSLPDAFSNYTRTAADWSALLPNLKVYGLSVGVGSGWDGAFDGAVDNVTYGTRAGGTTTFNFETPQTAAVPEPATWLTLILGMGAIGFAMRRQRKVKTIVNFA